MEKCVDLQTHADMAAPLFYPLFSTIFQPLISEPPQNNGGRWSSADLRPFPQKMKFAVVA